jgi:hypothetical protein
MAPGVLAQNASSSSDQQAQRPQQQWQQARGQSQDWSDPRLDPQSITIIGYDFDQDGQTDAWQAITRYDYERLRSDQRMRSSRPQHGRSSQYSQSSPYSRYDAQQRRWSQQDPLGHQMRRDARYTDQRRAMDQMRRDPRSSWGMAPQDARMNDMRWRQQAQSDRAPARLEGVVTKLTSFSFANDGDKRHLVGKLELNNGRQVPVHFGREDELSADIQKGERIRVVGQIGKLNDHRIVLADRVITRTGDHRIEQRSQDAKTALSGTIQSTKQVKLQDGRTSLVANLKTDDGRTVVVACGPREHLSENGHTLKSGDRVSLLARKVYIDRRPVYLSTWMSNGDAKARLAPSPARLRNAEQFTNVYDSLDSDW